jgi:hypothetical protein
MSSLTVKLNVWFTHVPEMKTNKKKIKFTNSLDSTVRTSSELQVLLHTVQINTSSLPKYVVQIQNSLKTCTTSDVHLAC